VWAANGRAALGNTTLHPCPVCRGGAPWQWGAPRAGRWCTPRSAPPRRMGTVRAPPAAAAAAPASRPARPSLSPAAPRQSCNRKPAQILVETEMHDMVPHRKQLANKQRHDAIKQCGAPAHQQQRSNSSSALSCWYVQQGTATTLCIHAHSDRVQQPLWDAAPVDVCRQPWVAHGFVPGASVAQGKLWRSVRIHCSRQACMAR
jgi:hypothetical protein